MEISETKPPNQPRTLRHFLERHGQVRASFATVPHRLKEFFYRGKRSDCPCC